jgi:hypothetical protein
MLGDVFCDGESVREWVVEADVVVMRQVMPQ